MDEASNMKRQLNGFASWFKKKKKKNQPATFLYDV